MAGPACYHTISTPKAGRSLDVLHLLAHLLAEDLGVEHGAGHLRVAALGAERVELAEDLLGQKVEAFAGGAGVAQQRAEVIEVSAQAVDLLAHVAAVDEQRDLLGDPALVEGLAAEQLV